MTVFSSLFLYYSAVKWTGQIRFISESLGTLAFLRSMRLCYPILTLLSLLSCLTIHTLIFCPLITLLKPHSPLASPTILGPLPHQKSTLADPSICKFPFSGSSPVHSLIFFNSAKGHFLSKVFLTSLKISVFTSETLCLRGKAIAPKTQEMQLSLSNRLWKTFAETTRKDLDKILKIILLKTSEMCGSKEDQMNYNP